jgi:phospholipid transport system substrate-binding protein
MRKIKTSDTGIVAILKAQQRALICLVVLCCSGVCTFPVSAASGPTETIKPVIEDVTKLLNNPKLQGDAHQDERRQKIMSTIKLGFDFQEMCKRVLGKTWQNISQAEKDRFTEQMTKLLENAYIGKLEDYRYKSIEYLDEKVQDDRAQVSTQVVKDDAKLLVHYVLQRTPKGWMVYDINIEGVSLVRNYMEQFRSILRTEDFHGLVKIIEQKNKTFAQTGKES